MGIQASAETLREMEKNIQDTIKNLEHASEAIIEANSSAIGWEDDKAAQFSMLMGKVSRLVASPVDTLKAAVPKLRALAEIIDDYNKTQLS